MRATKDASDTIAEAWSKDIRECVRLEMRCEQLTKELTAERERRVAAEEVINKLCDNNLGLIAAWQVLTEYRTKFPKGDDHG